jgi:hypothetical protein
VERKFQKTVESEMGRARLAQGFVELSEQKVQGGKFSPLHGKSIWSRDRFAFAIFFVLTVVMTNPLVLHLANAVEDKQDGLLNVWIIAWVGHALITDPFNLFNANIFYPYPNTLAFSETLLPQGLFALPFNRAFDNTILGYNLVLLASFFLAAYAMYLLVFDLTRARGAGVVAGIVFAFNPYNLGNLAQVQLLSFGWMPVALLFLRRLLSKSTVVSQQSTVNCRFSIADFRLCFLFAIFFSLQALSSFYYAFLAGFAVALYTLWFFISHHDSRITFYASRFTRLAIAAALIAIIVIPFFIPYLQVQREMGFERKVTESEPFSATLKLYTEVSPQNLVYGKLLAPNPPVMLGGYPLDNLFPGIIAVGLAIVGIATTKNRDKWFYFLLLTFSFLLSLGPRLFIAPNAPTDITLPYRWLYDAFPLMRALRAPVRFDALVMFALAILAGYGFSRITHHARWARFTNYQLPITLALIALEYLALPAAHITPVPVWNEIPEYVRWLRQQPPGVILELPMIASDPTKPLDLTTQYFSTYHWHTTPDGYSGFVPPRRGEIAYDMQLFPRLLFTTSLLQALDVNYLVIHTALISDWNWVDTGMSMSEKIAGGYAPEINLAQQFGDDMIYAVQQHGQSAIGLNPRLYLPNPITPNSNYTSYLIIRNQVDRLYATKPTDKLEISARWSDGTTQRATTSLPLVTTSFSIVPIRLTTPNQIGELRLDLQITNSLIGEWNLSGNVHIANEEPARQIVLPVTVSLTYPIEESFAPGETIFVYLTWWVMNKIEAYYSASVRVVDSRGNKIVALDGEPYGPTLLWKPMSLFGGSYGEIILPSDIQPGEYSLQIKMYQADQGIDALLIDFLEDDWILSETITLGKFTVK